MAENFYTKVYAMTRRIPRGRVATYGQIAALCGSPRAARQVGWALHELDGTSDMSIVPWQRVINRQGMISTTCEDHTAMQQAALLTSEGVAVTKKDGAYWIDLERFGWSPTGIPPLSKGR